MIDSTTAIDEAIANVLKGALKERGFNQEQAAERAGISLSTMQRYLAGVRTMPVPVFLALCRMVKYSPQQIVDRVDESLAPLTPIKGVERLSADEIDQYQGARAAFNDEEADQDEPQ